LDARVLLVAAAVGACDGSLGSTTGPPHVQRLVAGPMQLVGTPDSGCSAPADPTNDTWCAFYRSGGEGGATELWTLDITRAAQRQVPCDGSDGHCLRLTSNLWTGGTIFSPAHPEVHAFNGESLIFYADGKPGTPDDPFTGAVRVWRPGWSQSRVMTTGAGYNCYAHEKAPLAVCLDSVHRTLTEADFDLLAGSIADPSGGPLPRIDHIRAIGSAGQTLWGTAFSPVGDYLAVSSVATDADVEQLKVAKLSGSAAPVLTPILADASRWQISADGKKVYYLKDFGINNANNEADRSGTMMVADFPTGANPQVLAEQVPDFLSLDGAAGVDRGIAFLRNTVQGAGDFRIIHDRARPQDAITLDTGVEYFEVSPDLTYAFMEEPDSRDGMPEGILARLDGGGSCIFTVNSGYPVFHPVFLTKPRLMFWGDQRPDGPNDLEGWYADPEGCAHRRLFSPRLAQLQSVSDGIVYGEYAPGDAGSFLMTLRHARAAGDSLPEDGGEVLGQSVDYRLAVAGAHYVVFTISKGDPAAMGLYLYGPMP
jgi:hypothetical protein